MEENQLTGSAMTIPALSPDLNPIENVWSAIKTFLRSFVKPKKEKTSVLNCSVWNTLCWIVWPLRWPRSSRHTTCCPKCSLTNSVLVKFRVLSGLMCHQGLDSPEGYGLKYILDTGDFVVKTLTNTLWYIYIILRKGF